MGDYPTKHHTAAIHQHVRPYYLHLPNSPTTLLSVTKPSARLGCAETFGDPYHKQVPLPRIPDTRTHNSEARSPLSVQASVQPKLSRIIKQTANI